MPRYPASNTRELRASSSFDGPRATPQPSKYRLRSPGSSTPSTPQTAPLTSSRTSSSSHYPPPPREFTLSPTSTSSSVAPSRMTSSRSPWEASQDRQVRHVTSFSAVRQSHHPTPAKRTPSEESQSSRESTQPPFHLRHRVKLAIKDLFKKEHTDVEQVQEYQKLEDTHWTD